MSLKPKRVDFNSTWSELQETVKVDLNKMSLLSEDKKYPSTNHRPGNGHLVHPEY